MAAIANQVMLVSGGASVSNDGKELLVSLPTSNIGSVLAPNVFVTSITVGGAKRTSPQDFPVFVGDLDTGSTGAVNARFNIQGLNVGQKYLLTVRGTYGKTNLSGFTINRYIQIPPAADFPVKLLKSRVLATVQPAIWTYTIYNDEPAGSNLHIAAFSLDIVAPISVTNTPPGWQVETDFITYVGWVATDENMPFPNHIAPGKSLSGFEIQSATPKSESTSYVLTSWNHATQQAGLVGIDTVLSPARP